MIKSLFDNIEEEPQVKTEEINQAEAQVKPINLPEEDEMLLNLPEDEISLEIPDFNDVAMTVETHDLNNAVAKIETSDLNDEANTIETNDLNDAVANIETPFWQTAEVTSEILPPTEIPILHDVETIEEPIASPEISVSHATKTIDELRMQSNISNTRNATDAANEIVHVRAKPESFAETSRKSGLAMSAAIALFGSVVFLLIIGWFADLLLGTSPWGIVGGIVIGSLIGFFQFFRMTSQILKDRD